MGLSLGRLNDDSVHIVMLGLDAAGKTTVLYRLKFDQFSRTLPTIGFNCEKIRGTVGRAKGVVFTIWDVGGQDRVRPLWKSYTRATDGMLFVVDSNDLERMEEARVELARVVRTREASGVPLLILANKQDLPQARRAPEVERLLGASELRGTAPRQATASGLGGSTPGVGGRACCVMPACAMTGEGLDAALDQLYHMIRVRRKATRQNPLTASFRRKSKSASTSSWMR